MPTAQRTTRTQSERREQTRGELIDATIASLREHGYHATTTRRVAETAGASLGAISHHFPSRLDLIATTVDEVGHRTSHVLRDAVTGLTTGGPHRTEDALDALWDLFRGDLFVVWLKVWLAAAEDPQLHARLAPVERRLNDTLATIVAEARPAGHPADAWTRRMTVALDALRGLALRLAIEPREPGPAKDPWPAMRTELAAMIGRPSSAR